MAADFGRYQLQVELAMTSSPISGGDQPLSLGNASSFDTPPLGGAVGGGVYSSTQATMRVGGNVPLIVVGGVCNAVNIAVFAHRRMRKSRVNWFLLTLAVLDQLLLLANWFMIPLPVLVEWWAADNERAVRLTHLATRWAFPVGHFAQTAIVYVTVMLSFYRYVGVCHPFRAQTTLTGRRVFASIAACIVYSGLFTMPRWFELEMGPPNDTFCAATHDVCQTQMGRSDGYILLYKVVLYTLVIFVLPFAALAFTNFSIFKSIKASQRIRRRMTLAVARQLRTSQSMGFGAFTQDGSAVGRRLSRRQPPPCAGVRRRVSRQESVNWLQQNRNASDDNRSCQESLRRQPAATAGRRYITRRESLNRQAYPGEMNAADSQNRQENACFMNSIAQRRFSRQEDGVAMAPAQIKFKNQSGVCDANSQPLVSTRRRVSRQESSRTTNSANQRHLQPYHHQSQQPDLRAHVLQHGGGGSATSLSLSHLVGQQQQSQGSAPRRQRSRRETEMGITRMLLAVVTLFVVCNTLPFLSNCLEIAMHLDTPHSPAVSSGDPSAASTSDSSQLGAALFTILVEAGNITITLNSAANLVIYSVFSSAFRQHLTTVLLPRGGDKTRRRLRPSQTPQMTPRRMSTTAPVNAKRHSKAATPSATHYRQPDWQGNHGRLSMQADSTAYKALFWPRKSTPATPPSARTTKYAPLSSFTTLEALV